MENTVIVSDKNRGAPLEGNAKIKREGVKEKQNKGGRECKKGVRRLSVRATIFKVTVCLYRLGGDL